MKKFNIFKNFIGQSGTVSMSKKPEMPYTNAFIQELLRFRTLVPLNVPHVANQDTKIDEYIFPKNTIVRYDILEKLADYVLTWFFINRFTPTSGQFITILICGRILKYSILNDFWMSKEILSGPIM